MDLSLKEIIQFASQGGLSVVVLIIWYFTFTKADKTTAEAFKKHTDLNAILIQLLKDEQEYKITLTGVLDRISIKLETPAQCPVLMTGRKIKLEVME